MNDVLFDVRDVWFGYGAQPVVKNLHFTLERGKFFSIIGPNGSGKTTLLNLLTGDATAQQGDIHLFGQPLARFTVEHLARRFAIIQQGASIRFPFTCLDVVMMGRHPFASRWQPLRAEDMQIVAEAMQRTDTLRFADSLITEVSGGERQRVLFARALAQQPQVLFLDEAFSGLDMAHKIRSLRLIKSLVEQEQRTAVVIMHDLNLAYLFSDCLLVLQNGEIQGNGSPQEVMTPAFLKQVFDIHVQLIENRGLLVIPEAHED
jgi:iron complex transport system ATP-binding protein